MFVLDGAPIPDASVLPPGHLICRKARRLIDSFIHSRLSENDLCVKNKSLEGVCFEIHATNVDQQCQGE